MLTEQTMALIVKKIFRDVDFLASSGATKSNCKNKIKIK
jgi:hypothetical protein